MHGSPSQATPRGTPSRRGKSPRFSADSMSQPGSSTGHNTLANKHSTTFISSLDIPVKGAIPIETDSDDNSEPNDPSHPKPPDSKRAPRKSKTEAMAALNNQARSASDEGDEVDKAEDLADRYRNMTPIQVSPELDLSTVKTAQSAKRTKPSSAVQRPFGLTEAPTFYPTAEEFKDPMAYIRSITDKAREYGICKIVPPEGFEMPFVTDTKASPEFTIFRTLKCLSAQFDSAFTQTELSVQDAPTAIKLD
jgi:[histone H3]-trimethyl-L-lysine4 demethylase